MKFFLAALMLAASTVVCAQEAGKKPRRFDCSQAKDPATCEANVKKLREAHAKEGAARRAQVREACKGKEGEELKACIREQRASSQRGKAGADKKSGEKK